MSPKTLTLYLGAARQLIDHLASDPANLTPADLTRADIEEFLADYATTHSPATVSLIYRALQQLVAWMVGEDWLTTNPMARMKPPIVPEQPVPVLTDSQVRALLATCAGKGFADCRDTAIIRLLIDTGGRRAEIADLYVEDVDMRLDQIQVLGKGRRGAHDPVRRQDRHSPREMAAGEG